MGSTRNIDIRLDAKVVVSLIYLSNFWRSLDLRLINCETKLDFSWSRYFVIPEISRRSRTVGNPKTQEMVTTTISGTNK